MLVLDCFFRKVFSHAYLFLWLSGNVVYSKQHKILQRGYWGSSESNFMPGQHSCWAPYFAHMPCSHDTVATDIFLLYQRWHSSSHDTVFTLISLPLPYTISEIHSVALQHFTQHLITHSHFLARTHHNVYSLKIKPVTAVCNILK
jgi:hypothetical protein